MYSDSDNEDSLKIKIACITGAVAAIILAQVPALPSVWKQIEWDAYAAKLEEEGKFEQTYCMSWISFDWLCDLIKPHLVIDPVMSQIRSDQVIH